MQGEVRQGLYVHTYTAFKLLCILFAQPTSLCSLLFACVDSAIASCKFAVQQKLASLFGQSFVAGFAQAAHWLTLAVFTTELISTASHSAILAGQLLADKGPCMRRASAEQCSLHS